MELNGVYIIVGSGGRNCPFSEGYLGVRASYLAQLIMNNYDMSVYIYSASNPNSTSLVEPNSLVIFLLFPQSYRIFRRLGWKLKSSFGDKVYIALAGLLGMYDIYSLLENSFLDAVIASVDFEGVPALVEHLLNTFTPARRIIFEERRVLPSDGVLPFYLYTNRVHVALSWGCPYKCAYCPFPALNGGRWMRNIDPVRLAEAVSRVVGDEVHIVLEDSVIDPVATLRFLRALSSRGIDVWAECNVRPETVDASDIMLLAGAGCKKITMGIESCSKRVQWRIGKNLNLEKARLVASLFKDYGVRVKLNFMVGLPGQDKEDIIRCVSLIREVHPDEVGVHVLLPYPGTRLYRESQSYGVFFTPRRWWASGIRPEVRGSMSWGEIRSLAKMLEEAAVGVGAVISRQY